MRQSLTLLLLLCTSVAFSQKKIPTEFSRNTATALSCNNWLRTPAAGSSCKIGDLDVTGNQLTVEAVVNWNSPINPSQVTGDIVSKHQTPSDCNYLLRPNDAEITTTNGFFVAIAPTTCNVGYGKTFHLAMVYNGSSLRYYRNGYLLKEVPASGNLVQNDWITAIGDFAPGNPPTLEHFNGYINEVRIWNVARSEASLRTYMNTSLPTPALQTGLLAYYTFDNLLNKQGNTTWNGSLAGAATINVTNPACTLSADSCNIPVVANAAGIGGIINSYTPVIGFLPCENNINIEDASFLKVGDTVLIIQMKGAVIDSSNTAAFGGISDYKNAGNYEFNYVQKISGNTVTLRNNLTRQYDIPVGKVQLIRVPYFLNANVTATLSCLPWNGTVGGVLALNVRDTLTLSANVSAVGTGFRGGNSPNTFATRLFCFENNYNYPVGSLTAASKGESIASIGSNIAWGKGAPANGGGGGLGHNSGGGGGASYGRGGFGGYQLQSCGNAPFDNRGIGGNSTAPSGFTNKIFLGGGGGSGHVDNRNGSNMNGGNGGGIIIITAKAINSNGFNIISKGANGPQCTIPPFGDCHDGNGGGGGGGTILIETNGYIGTMALDASGGKGADLSVFDSAAGAGRIGPGGGGGGGIVFHSNVSLPANVTTILSGGNSGVILQDNNRPWGATAGQNGNREFNLKLPVDTVLFKKNIDSVGFASVKNGCADFNFNGLAYTSGAAPINSWVWTFGDGAAANTQNTAHTYTAQGTYTVKLVITDANGCKDSVSKVVTANQILLITRNPDTTVCKNVPVQLFASGGTNYVWSPAATLSNPNIPNPVASPGLNSTVYYVTVSQGTSCSKRDSVKVTVSQAANFKVDAGSGPGICIGNSRQLNASGGNSYRWSPAAGLSDATISNPVALISTTTVYSVTIRDTVCNDSATLTTQVVVFPKPSVTAISTNDISCALGSSQLVASGANSYTWLPASSLTNPNTSRPVAAPIATTVYTVIGTDVNKCIDSAFVTVGVQLNANAKYYMPNSFTPNGDGLNDCFGLKNWGQVTKLQFSIFNRWGQRVFYTENPTTCWDGKVKGEPQQSSNFIYLIKATTICGKVDMKGNVILVR